MICYSTKHKKHIGINIQTSINLERISPLIENESYIYHIWNCSEIINLLLVHLQKNIKENNVYIHLNSIKELYKNREKYITAMKNTSGSDGIKNVIKVIYGNIGKE